MIFRNLQIVKISRILRFDKGFLCESVWHLPDIEAEMQEAIAKTRAEQGGEEIDGIHSPIRGGGEKPPSKIEFRCSPVDAGWHGGD